jgi:hypothetical protein
MPRLARLLAAMLPLVFAVSTVTPAAAIIAPPPRPVCATAGHAYAIHNGSVYQSGYEGNYQNGVQYLVLPSGTPFEVGGNGLKPDSFLQVDLYPGDTVPANGIPQHLTRPKVGGNCVVNQEWIYPSTAYTGTWSLVVEYTGGLSGANVRETVVFVVFIWEQIASSVNGPAAHRPTAPRRHS